MRVVEPLYAVYTPRQILNEPQSRADMKFNLRVARPKLKMILFFLTMLRDIAKNPLYMREKATRVYIRDDTVIYSRIRGGGVYNLSTHSA